MQAIKSPVDLVSLKTMSSSLIVPATATRARVDGAAEVVEFVPADFKLKP